MRCFKITGRDAAGEQRQGGGGRAAAGEAGAEGA
jgi:hypothetical protein